MKTEKRRIGDIGENAAAEFLKRRGYEIMDRNYLRKWGELDIVARKGSLWHFVEVKSSSGHVSHESFAPKQGSDVSRGTSAGGYRPEENVHPQKLKRLYRAIQTYLLEKRIDADWQLDIITVKVDESTRQARCEIIENIII